MSNIPQTNRKRNLSTEPIFYTYMYRRNGIPFYIGKGSHDRINAHERCAHKHTSCKHLTCRVIRKEWREGGIITKEKICEDVTEASAHSVECLMIAYGVASGWPLVNQTKGGEGVSGYIRDAEWGKRRSALIKQGLAEGKYTYLKTPKTEHLHTPEMREKSAKATKEAWSDPKLREKKGIQSKKMWESPEYRERHRQAMARPGVRTRNAPWKGKESPVAKDYQGFVSPQGVIHSPVHNLSAFCQKHGLQKSGMCLVAQGKQSQHLGWTRYPPIEKHPYKGLGFISPSGDIYNDIPHLSKFCEQHGLRQNVMSEVASGKRKSHKGWTRYDPEHPSQKTLF